MGRLAVTVKNDASADLYISKDPNWDDQVLTMDGVPQHRAYILKPGSSVVVGITDEDYNEMGVIFSQGEDDAAGFYQLSIGPDPDTGNQSVTDEFSMHSPTVKYALSDQEPLSMTMTFVDI